MTGTQEWQAPPGSERSGRIALVGIGYWGPNLLRNLVATVGLDRLVVVDRSVDRLAAAAATYPGLALEVSLDQTLDTYDVAGVVIATPVSTHHSLARVALSAGCHVLVEKPLAASTYEAEELVALADDAGVTLMTGHTFLFSPRVELMERYLAEGRLGAVQYITSARLNLGLHQSDISVIWDLAPHDLSIIFRILGEVPASVRATGRSMLHPERPEVAFLNLEFPSGVIASVTVSWLAPSKSRSTVVVGDRQMLVYEDLDSEQPIRLYDKGVVLPEPMNFGEHQLTYRHGDVVAPHVPAAEPLAREIEHFLGCIAGAHPCRSDGRFGLGVVRALEAAELSWSAGGERFEICAPAAGLARHGLPAGVPAPLARIGLA